jgi:hypothetical protein
MRHLVVDRSTARRMSGGRNGNWVDGIAAQATGAELVDETNHLAKVRIAGSNPVVRSKKNMLVRLLMRPTAEPWP